MAVGFEWQSSWKIYKSDAAPQNDAQKKYFPKNTVLATGIGWKLVTDGADMEFVTDPITLDLKSQTDLAMDGETNLSTTMTSIAHFCADLDAHHASASIDRATNPSLFRDFPKTFVIVPFPANQTMAAFVQVSGGVRLSQLRKFFKAIGTQDSQISQDFLGTYHNAYSTTLRKVHLPKAAYVDTTRPAHPPGPKMRSLAELIALYMNQFRQKGPTQKAKVVKYMTFIMARTDFAKLFDEIEAPEALYYRAHPDDWVRYICVDIMKQISGFDPVHGAAPDGRVIEYPINDMDDLPDNRMVNIEISRRAWLKGMTQGKDLLTAEVHPTGWKHPVNKAQYEDRFGNHRLRGLGGLGGTMDTLAMNGLVDNQGAIFEFRGQQSNIPYTTWKTYTIRVYRFLQTVNFGQQNT